MVGGTFLDFWFWPIQVLQTVERLKTKRLDMARTSLTITDE